MKGIELVRCIRAKMDPNSANRAELRLLIRHIKCPPDNWVNLNSLRISRGKLSWLVLKTDAGNYRFLLREP
jgi:hypothetical protein